MLCRLCRVCKLEVEGENHFVLKCSKLASVKAKMVERLNESVAVLSSMDESSRLIFVLSSNDNDIMNICISGLSLLIIA